MRRALASLAFFLLLGARSAIADEYRAEDNRLCGCSDGRNPFGGGRWVLAGVAGSALGVCAAVAQSARRRGRPRLPRDVRW